VRAARGFPTEVCGQLFVCSAGRRASGTGRRHPSWALANVKTPPLLGIR
jgi:hypothetical protein